MDRAVSKFVFFMFLGFTFLSVSITWFFARAGWLVFLPLIITWFISFFKMLYDFSAKFYFLINKYWAYFLNKSTKWELSVFYELDCDIENIAKFLEFTSKTISDDFDQPKFWQNTNLQKIIHVPGITIRIKTIQPVQSEALGFSLEKPGLAIDFTDMEIPFRSTNKILSQKLAPIFEKLHRELPADYGKYSLRIRYDGDNPFFGLYVRRLPSSQISKFHCEIFEVFGKETDNVSIERNQTVIVTSTVSGFLTLSRKYLSLSFV